MPLRVLVLLLIYNSRLGLIDDGLPIALPLYVQDFFLSESAALLHLPSSRFLMTPNYCRWASRRLLGLLRYYLLSVIPRRVRIILTKDFHFMMPYYSRMQRICVALISHRVICILSPLNIKFSINSTTILCF